MTPDLPTITFTGDTSPDGWATLARELIMAGDNASFNNRTATARILYDAGATAYIKAASACMGHGRRKRYEEEALNINEVLRSIDATLAAKESRS